MAGAVNGHGSIRICLAEISQMNRCNVTRLQDAEHYIALPSLPEGIEELEKVILANTIKYTNVKFTVSLNDSGRISRCMCSYQANNRTVCNHMFIVEQLLGYTIFCNFSGNGGPHMYFS